MLQYKYFYTKRTAAKIRSFVIDGDTIKVVDACHAQNMHD